MTGIIVALLVSAFCDGLCIKPEEGIRNYTFSKSVTSNSVKLARQYWPSPPAQSSPINFLPVVCPVNNPAWNTMIAMQFVQAVSDLNPVNLDKYIAPNYIQHSPNMPDGLETMRAVVSPGGSLYEASGGKPSTVFFEHVSADEDYVWLHLKMITTGQIQAKMELYRFECGFIKEHWTVIQNIDPTTPVYNSHPYF